ncbi:MAG TPA: ATP-binding protein [Mucilaginibacter sp.]|nr:ATP-binding protein [Mucilaginibacter sp.]
MTPDTPGNLPENLFRVLFEKSPGSLLVKADAPCFTIVAASDAYLAITSVQRDDVVGKGFFEVFPDIDDDPEDETTARKVFAKVISTCEKLDVPVYRYDVIDQKTNKKEPHYWSCSNIPILGANNKVAYILNTIIDITGEVKAKEVAIESESRLLMAAEATGLAIWDLDLKDANFTYSPQLIELFGHNTEDDITLSSVRSQVHPDDMQNIVQKAYNDALLTGKYAYEVRIFWPDNSLHWIRTRGAVLFNEKKEAVRMLGTIVDITESKRDEIRKNDFIAMASHELKTPLTSLKAYIQLLEAKLAASPDPFIHTALLKSGNQVSKMTALIHSFLDLSKLEPGKLQLKRQVFDINKLVEETIAENIIINNTHIIRFHPLEVININADREKIGQVLSNLISNAIKYSQKGSTIMLRSEVLDGNIRVSVTDDGIGIKSKDQEKVFQRFYRAEDEDLKNISGFGIGLYLSSEIIQRHKGKIWVKSKDGKGSTFYFSLPLV